MKICFRVDASVYIGTGHVMRCLVLAEALRKAGYIISFASLPLKNNLIDFVESKGFTVIKLSLLGGEIFPNSNSDYQSWLQRTQKEDASDFILKADDLDVVVTDHYGIDHIWETIVKETLNCKLIAIDDLARRHAADLVLDQTLGRTKNEYPDSKNVLTGPYYALLSRGFLLARESALDRVKPTVPVKVLISMGGIDAQNMTLTVLEALIGQLNAKFTILLSERSPNYKVINNWCENYEEVEHIDFTENMPSVMLDHDIAIGAPGTTSWERACLGLPSVVIPIAENQKEIGEQLSYLNAAIRVEKDDIKCHLLESVRRLIKSWEIFHKINTNVCDGRGTQRVVRQINGLVKKGPQLSVELNPASEHDIKLVYQWQSQADARKYALNTKIPAWDEHRKWMLNKLNSGVDFMFIISDVSSAHKVGVLRLDRQSNSNYLVSILIASEYNKRGFASAALECASDLFSDLNLHATVLEANVASQKLFQRAGYKRLTTETFIKKSFE